jgi:hypothetical protein
LQYRGQRGAHQPLRETNSLTATSRKVAEVAPAEERPAPALHSLSHPVPRKMDLRDSSSKARRWISTRRWLRRYLWYRRSCRDAHAELFNNKRQRVPEDRADPPSSSCLLQVGIGTSGLSWIWGWRCRYAGAIGVRIIWRRVDRSARWFPSR